ncbi:MAG: pseudouridine synthase, partial [Filifactor alocis]|nr:pseudouridine synthase [Filifactor alocis]
VVITLGEEKVYYALHKPVGYISAVSDNRGRKTVVELIDTPHRLYPVGRLDYMSEGLLLLTNDGEFTNRMIHPRYHIEKTYLVCVSGKEPKNIKDLFQRGIWIDEYKTKPSNIVLLNRKDQTLTYRITLFEGRNRQIRKMFQSLDMKVLSLKRISIGKLQLGDLEEGGYRRLTDQELAYFKTKLK